MKISLPHVRVMGIILGITVVFLFLLMGGSMGNPCIIQIDFSMYPEEFEGLEVEIDGEIALLMEAAARYPHLEEAVPAAVAPPPAPSEEAEAALDEVVTRQDPMPASLVDDVNVEIHVDDMNVAELGVSEEELLELLNIHVPGRDPETPSA